MVADLIIGLRLLPLTCVYSSVIVLYLDRVNANTLWFRHLHLCPESESQGPNADSLQVHFTRDPGIPGSRPREYVCNNVCNKMKQCITYKAFRT